MLKSDRKNISTLLAVIVLLIFLHFTNVLLPFEGLVRAAVNPVLSNIFSIGHKLNNENSPPADSASLASQVESLKQEINRLTVENTGLKMVEEENQQLREYLDFFKDHDEQYVLADVISRGELSDLPVKSQELVINKGSNSGLSVGRPVLNSEGMIIGKISEVKNNEAKVVLATDGKCKLAATILNSDKTAGVTEGSLGLTIGMNFIPQTDDVKAGDIIVTSGLEADIPRGLIIGKVTQVDKENNEVWQQAAIEPMVNYNELTVVSILLSN